MKAAWLVVGGPRDLKREALARLEVIADTYLSVNAAVQLAMPIFLEQRGGFQEQLLARARENLAELDRQLSIQKACSRLAVEGGWYVVLRVPTTRSDEELVLDLLGSKGVHVHPGHFYDFPSHGFMILSLIIPAAMFSLGVTDTLEIAE
jgi:alanine-synthesizing transaminase